MGVTAKKIAACADSHGFKAYEFTESMESAVKRAAELAQPGDAVLLSPACASWDMFPNFKVRGRVFRDCLLALED